MGGWALGAHTLDRQAGVKVKEGEVREGNKVRCTRM